MTQLQPKDFYNILSERGFIHQCTDEKGLKELFAKGPVTAYIGFDCTATSLHVGSLVQIMILRWLQKTGNKPIILLGGATTKIGDPSGKDESRPPLSDEQIEMNKAGIAHNFRQFGLDKAKFVDNSEWVSKLHYIDFLRDYGRHFSVNRMLTQDSVKLRLERDQPLSFLEFNYMVLQAYDFYELSKSKGCRLQIGGSDQWGNIISGIELGRRKNAKGIGEAKIGGFAVGVGEANSEKELFGLTTPLLTTADGKKMGKTADGAVWLDASLCSPYDYWQFWRNTNDKDVERFLKLFTELDLSEIKNLMAGNINEAKKVLANEATKLCHGEKAAQEAAETARKVFEEGAIGGNLPTIEIPKSELEKGIPAFSLLHRAGLSESATQARKLIQGKGGRINDDVIQTEQQPVTLKDINSEGVIKLSAGKKHHAIVKAV